MMYSTAKRTGALLSRFRREEQGVAAIEFAFIAPLLVVFLLGTTTATQSLWAHGKVSQTSSVLGDLISQESTLTDDIFGSLMNAAPVLMEPFPLNDLKIDVTAAIACHENPNNTEGSTPSMFVVWSRGWSDSGLGRGNAAPGDPLSNAPGDLSVEDGDYIIRTTVSYTYEPTIARKADYDIEMEEIAYHQPRDDRPVTYPSQEGSPDTKDCNKLMNR